MVSWEQSALFWCKFPYIPFFYCFSQFSFKTHPNFSKVVLPHNAIFPFLLNDLTAVQPFKWQHFSPLVCLQLNTTNMTTATRWIFVIFECNSTRWIFVIFVQYLKSNPVYYAYNYTSVWKQSCHVILLFFRHHWGRPFVNLLQFFFP